MPSSHHTSLTATAFFFRFLNQKSINWIQTVQNRFWSHHSYFSLFTHLPSVCLRIDFKILLITSKALHSLSPCYISDLFVQYAPECTLRSSGQRLFVWKLKMSVCSHGPEDQEQSAHGHQVGWASDLWSSFLKHTFLESLILLEFLLSFISFHTYFSSLFCTQNYVLCIYTCTIYLHWIKIEIKIS